MTVRFAPSPTGRFHIGNLRTAWLSGAWARYLRIPWVVRFENIDSPRNVPGAMDEQLGDMKILNLVPDAVIVQSENIERHWNVFEKMHAAGLVYPCVCSRKTIREAVEAASSAPHRPVPGYTGHCRTLDTIPKKDLPTWAWRIRNHDESGRDDFVVARTSPSFAPSGGPDRLSFAPAYHWACAVDDYDGDHRLLVRAWDLEDAAPLQRLIHEYLAQLEGTSKPFPAIFHGSLVTGDDGSRLEKRTMGTSLQEVLETGWTGSSIVAAFEKSFTGVWEKFEPQKIFGERLKTLKLRELLQRPD